MDGEDIGQIAIVGLCPQMRVGAGIDQLRVHPHFVGRALHTAFDNMRHAELLTDLAQIARRAALVLHHRGAADHLQVRDLRQVGQDFVLHAIGEEGVLRVAAQVFKWQHCDRLLPAIQPLADCLLGQW